MLQPAENLEAAFFHHYELNQTTLSADGFSNMSHLKLLKINCQSVSGSLDYLPSELGYLSWDGYPFKCLPTGFLPYKLVSLSLIYSNIKQLWEDTKVQSVIVLFCFLRTIKIYIFFCLKNI